ncbi:hypothetical protein C2845_PM08G17310 [Panicum miliaceum]|uniref:Uncharacterized protein n=1 Tax=Panicum miliaceum TaxID=4540 RepID=A0A3L6R2H8_PANMI|nr:hypothetical protein C2845_PM08G17310 [Panicum miliaceum]
MERVPNILEYDEDTNVIFVWMHAGVFTIQLESMEFKSLFSESTADDLINPYYTYTSLFDTAFALLLQQPPCWNDLESRVMEVTESNTATVPSALPN